PVGLEGLCLMWVREPSPASCLAVSSPRRITCARAHRREARSFRMLAYLRKSFLPSSRPSQKRSARPLLESLEERLLLYSAYGGTWAYGTRITYSFMPDGTSVGGTPSALFQTLNAKFSQATWELQFQNAAAVWQAVANINLSQVSDNGSAEACNGNQQDDPR